MSNNPRRERIESDRSDSSDQPQPSHIPGTKKGEEQALTSKEAGREAGRKNYQDARDATGNQRGRPAADSSGNAADPAGIERVTSSSFAALRRFAKPSRQPVLERCELCNLVLPPVHRHLLDMATRQVACSCDPCALLFQNAVGAKFKLIPREGRALPNSR